MIKLKDILREIGEANIAPFNWTKTSGDSPQQFKEKMGMEVFEEGYDTIITYKFTTDKGTQYVVDLQIEEDKEWEKGIECEIDFSISDVEGKHLPMDATNRHEQYAVMSTITDILVAWVNEWDKEFYISRIKIDPIEDEDKRMDISPSGYNRTQNKRGKLYYAFMKKQLHKLEKDYKINVFDNHFEISPKS